MSSLDNKTIDDVTLKLSGIIGTFELIVNLLGGSRNNEKRVMLDFAFFISKELQELYSKISSVDYYDELS